MTARSWVDWRSGRDDSSCAPAPAGLPQKIAQLLRTLDVRAGKPA
jgi:hypothetical protein